MTRTKPLSTASHTAAERYESDRPAGAGDLYIAQPGITGPPAYLADLDVVTAGPR